LSISSKDWINMCLPLHSCLDAEKRDEVQCHWNVSRHSRFSPCIL
jgi:hypothetical protein